MPFSADTPSGGIPPTFHWPVHFCLAITLASYLLSLLTANVSQVDRLWTFLPVAYSAYWALLPLWPHKALVFLAPYTPHALHDDLVYVGNPRTRLMLLLQVLWMLRLSYNTWRRGLFNFKDEDYRWDIVRSRIPNWAFQLLNLVFISLTQNILLFLLAFPTHTAALLPPQHRQLTAYDAALAALSLAALAGEFVADNQQYAFQAYKRSAGLRVGASPDHAPGSGPGLGWGRGWHGANLHFTRADAQRGFITRGLWAWSRHPNFLCEQSFWFLQALFPILSPPQLQRLLSQQGDWDWTPLVSLVPPVALSALFLASTCFTESISAGKYPVAYRAYQRRVAMFVPLLTPLWGGLLSLQGDKAACDRLVYGDGLEQKSD